MDEFKEKYVPKLIDYNIKLFLHNSLKKTYEYKLEFYNNLFNILLFGFFILFLIVFLYFRYKGKLTYKELKQKDNEKRLYVLSKLQQLSNIQNSENNKLITNLPEFVY
jgi:cell division protein FtsI/penicillin-binding protein 2